MILFETRRGECFQLKLGGETHFSGGSSFYLGGQRFSGIVTGEVFKLVAEIFGDPKVGGLVAAWTSFSNCGITLTRAIYQTRQSLCQSIKGCVVLLAFIAKIKGIVQEKFSGALPQILSSFTPPIINPGRISVREVG